MVKSGHPQIAEFNAIAPKNAHVRQEAAKRLELASVQIT